MVMADIEHRIAEYVDGHFASLDVKLAELYDLAARHSTRFTNIEAQIANLGRKLVMRF
jgi:hypothetical protein